MKKENTLVEELTQLLRNGNAHASMDDALKGISFEMVSKKVRGLPYNIWQLAEHLRIAQWDLVEFSKSKDHQSPDWPSGYWPGEKCPSEKEWKKCLKSIRDDREEMISLLQKAGDKLFEPFPWGSGQSLLREVLVLADHNSYHTGGIIVLRRLLGIWGK